MKLHRFALLLKSTEGKPSPKVEDGPNTPKRRAPLASGGRTSGKITITFKKNLPRNLYRAKQYARGIPKKMRSNVEIVDEIKLKIKALSA